MTTQRHCVLLGDLPPPLGERRRRRHDLGNERLQLRARYRVDVEFYAAELAELEPQAKSA